MADPLYDLLAPSFETDANTSRSSVVYDADTASYINRLSSLPLASLTSSEARSLAQTHHSLVLSLQSLSTRSHRSIIASSDHLTTLNTSLPRISIDIEKLQSSLPQLDQAAVQFSANFNKNANSPLLERRRKAMLLSRNAGRLSDILELPGLLSSAISSSTSGSAAPSVSGVGVSASSTTANHGSALDLHAHIRRLHTLFPTSRLISSVSIQAEEAMRNMSTNLIASLRTQSIKLAGAIRTIGWLRRVAPELDEGFGQGNTSALGSNGGGLESLFLVCRLANLVSMLDALEPLRDLADQEIEKRLNLRHQREEEITGTHGSGWTNGQQTERYLKRFIEIFREQSFSIISMYKSIFPSSASGSGLFSTSEDRKTASGGGTPSLRTSVKAEPNGMSTQYDPLQPLPPPLAAFSLHLIKILTETLKKYLPNVRDSSARESLLTQVLYCAGSLGRLGGDFCFILASLDVMETDDEAGEGLDVDGEVEGETEDWVEVVRKHRVLAGRLELLASGVGNPGSSGGTARTSSRDISPAA